MSMKDSWVECPDMECRNGYLQDLAGNEVDHGLCAYGLVPPDEMIETAGTAIAYHVYDLPIGELGSGTQADIRREAKTVLVAVARVEVTE